MIQRLVKIQQNRLTNILIWPWLINTTPLPPVLKITTRQASASPWLMVITRPARTTPRIRPGWMWSWTASLSMMSRFPSAAVIRLTEWPSIRIIWLFQVAIGAVSKERRKCVYIWPHWLDWPEPDKLDCKYNEIRERWWWRWGYQSLDTPNRGDSFISWNLGNCQ